jgi:hypothetical protein
MSIALLMALAQDGFEQCKSTYAGRGTGEATSAMGRISDAWVASSPIDWVPLLRQMSDVAEPLPGGMGARHQGL